MGTDDADAAVLAGKFEEMRPHLDERAWRLYLGSEARTLAVLRDCALSAAVASVAAAAGVSRATVSAGAGELAEGAEAMPGRSRQPGAGRKKAEEKQPGLKEALDAVLEAGRRGDPETPVIWNILSLRDVEREMAARGLAVKKDAIARIMHEDGYSLRGMSRVKEGKQYPGRDAQFARINEMIDLFRMAGEPVISADTKKKELIGEYHRAGRTWRPAGQPQQVRDHDFADQDTARVCPYGIYDIAANTGFVSVGTSHDTGAFAVNGIRLWWRHQGSLRYSGAEHLLVTCDAGGSNGHRCRLWKRELAGFARETGLTVIVMHFPPGTSKWNKVEHRLFCHITRTWSQSPLLTLDDAVAGIAATTTGQGLKVTAVRDDGDYPTGTEISDREARDLQARHFDRDPVAGSLCYAVLPEPREIPAPAPRPLPAPGPGPEAGLAQALAALAGITDLSGLREQIAPDWENAREQRLARRRQQRGSTRRSPDSPGGYRGSGGYGKLSDDAVLAAAACHVRLGLPWQFAGRLFGVWGSSLNVPGSALIPVLEKHGITAPPDDPRINTPDKLLACAAAAGITIPGQPQDWHST